MKTKNNKLIIEVIVGILFLICMIPFLLVLINSGKDAYAVTNSPLSLPTNWYQIIENAKTIWTSENIRYKESFLSSVIITVLSLFFITNLAAMAAWVLLRDKSRKSNIIFMLFVASMVIPFQVVMLPLVSWFRILSDFIGIKLLRSYSGMILAYMGFGMPLSIFLFHGNLKSIPLELEEAAKIDGCSKAQVFFKMILPNIKPMFVTVLVLNGVWIWNDFLLPLLILGKGNDVQTIPLAVANFVGAFVKQWDLILTAALMSIIPIIILFIFAQKYIIGGMMEGSVKS